MLFDNPSKNKEKIKYLISKFGRGEYYGTTFKANKGRKLKIGGNFESNYDLTNYFMSLSNTIKIKKGIFFVPKDLEYTTNLNIIEEKEKTIYKQIKVEGEGFFKAPFFIFIGEMENEFGKLKTKKKDSQNKEDEKKFFKITELSLKKDTPFPYEFNSDFEYLTKIIIRKIHFNNSNTNINQRLNVIRDLKIIKEIKIDENTKKEEFELEI